MRSTLIFFLLVQFVIFTLGCLAAHTDDLSLLKSPSERGLQLDNCIPDTDDEIVEEEDLDIPKRFGKLRQFETNSRGRALLKRIRRKSAEFYSDLVDTVIKAMCDVETESLRCVDETSGLAVKNENDECIVAADFTCGAGLCERSSNCYWKQVVEGEDRETRFPTDEYETAMDELKDYGKGSYTRGILQWPVVGIAVATGLLLLWLLYYIARYCCCCLWTRFSLCCLCSPIPRDEGYKIFIEWMIPIFLYILGFVGIVASGCIALIGHDDINVAATASFAYVSRLVEDLGRFLVRARNPLSEVKDIVQFAAADAVAVFNNTGFVNATAMSIVASFSDFNTLHSAQLPSAASASFDQAETLFSDNVQPIVNDIQRMLDTLEDDVYDNVDIIQTSLSVAISQIDSFENETSLWIQDIHKYEGQEDSTRVYRQLALLGIFLVGGTIAVAGLIGIITSRRPGCSRIHSFMNMSGILSSLLGSLTLILASVTLLVSFLWLDVCEISDVVVQDFEPLLGETIARGANAMFNDENLAEAYNLEDKIDFQEKLDSGLKVLEDVNITKEFQQVVSPLEGIQTAVDGLSAEAFGLFKNLTYASSTPDCSFNDLYSEDNILEPWLGNENKTKTTWFVNGTGDVGDYSRFNNESAEEYMDRIYSVAGKCEGSAQCCLNNVCSRGIGTTCNSGTQCKYDLVCKGKSMAIQQGFDTYLQIYNTEQSISADLGVICPLSLNCPTAAFEGRGHNDTVVGLVKDYGEDIKGTADDLVSITTTSLGQAMIQVKRFLCNMDMTFVANRYTQVRDEVCGSMLGGFTQINWALWALGIFLEIVAILANALATRLRGMSRGEANDSLIGSDGRDSRYVSPKIGMEDEV